MKKIVALFLVSLLLNSCEDKEEVDVLIGKWIPETIIINGVSITYDGHAQCGNDYLQINNFNTFEIVDYIVDSSAKTTSNESCPFEKYYGSYTVINNELKLSGSNFFQGGEIIEKTSTTLKLKRMIDVDGDSKDDEVIEVFTR